MKKFSKMKNDINKCVPAFWKLFDDTIEDIPEKFESLINNAAKGLEKLFSPR